MTGATLRVAASSHAVAWQAVGTQSVPYCIPTRSVGTRRGNFLSAPPTAFDGIEGAPRSPPSLRGKVALDRQFSKSWKEAVRGDAGFQLKQSFPYPRGLC